MEKTPKLSVVTVTYNAQDFIEKTILSIINQTFRDFEYIVIDGASNDNTQNVISSYSQNISVYISEPDQGLYDAMNKAIAYASGDWIIFMNAGDTFFDEHTLEKVFSMPAVEEADFIYGSFVWDDGKQQSHVPVRPLELMWQRICFSHQSLFSRTNLMKEKPFDLGYQIVSDYENYYRRYCEGKKFLNAGVPISVFIAGGISNVNFLKRTYERWKVVRQYKGTFSKWHLYYLKLILGHYRNEIRKYVRN